MAAFLPRLIPLALLLSCGALHAQGDPPTVGLEIPRDPLSGMGHGLLIAGDDDIVRRLPNEQALRPAPFQASATPGRPLYRIYGPGGVFPGAQAGDVRFDAISTGNDILPANNQGEIGFPPGSSSNPTGMPSWVNVAISVGANALGLQDMPPGLRTSMPTTITADLYSYWFEHNISTGPTFIDAAFLSDGHEHLGLQSDDDIVGIDTFMQLLADNPTDGVIAVVDLELYFSVTPTSAAWLRSNPAGRFSFGPGQSLNDVTAATIFKTVWSPAAAAWGPVTIEYLPSELCNAGEPVPTDIDALAYDARNLNPGFGPNRALLFSETPGGASAARSQLRILVRNNFGATVFIGDAKTGSGQDLRNRIGIRNVDDVDAICGKDPEADLSSYLAAPIEPLLPMPHSFGLKVEHVNGRQTGELLSVQVHNLNRLRAELGTSKLDGVLQLHVWQVDSSNVRTEPPGGHWVHQIDALPAVDDDLSIELPDPVAGSAGLLIALQAVYIPARPARRPIYVSWRLAMRY